MQSIKFFYCLICHCAVFMCKHVLYVSSIDLSFNARCGYSTTCMHVYIYVYVLPSVYIGWIRTCVHIWWVASTESAVRACAITSTSTQLLVSCIIQWWGVPTWCNIYTTATTTVCTGSLMLSFTGNTYHVRVRMLGFVHTDIYWMLPCIPCIYLFVCTHVIVGDSRCTADRSMYLSSYIWHILRMHTWHEIDSHRICRTRTLQHGRKCRAVRSKWVSLYPK
jgi:hypothetical protein